MFHWRDNIYFQRESLDSKGDVHIYKMSGSHHGSHIEFSFTIPAAEWASIVAAVSNRGETSEQYEAALELHNG